MELVLSSKMGERKDVKVLVLSLSMRLKEPDKVVGGITPKIVLKNSLRVMAKSTKMRLKSPYKADEK